MTVYTRAPEVALIAKQLIEDVPEHQDLDAAHIEYVWRDQHAKEKGRAVLGKARKVSGLNGYLINGGDLFVIEIAEDTWKQLDEKQRIALVDHELCHLRVDFDDDGEPKLSLRGHDLEEFAGIVERHGLWASDVAAFGSAVAEQLVLAVEEVDDFLRGLDDDSERG